MVKEEASNWNKLLRFILLNIAVSVLPTFLIGLSPNCFGRCQSHVSVNIGFVFLGINLLFFAFYMVSVEIIRMYERYT